jgi:hypothetical protein
MTLASSFNSKSTLTTSGRKLLAILFWGNKERELA